MSDHSGGSEKSLGIDEKIEEAPAAGDVNATTRAMAALAEQDSVVDEDLERYEGGDRAASPQQPAVKEEVNPGKKPGVEDDKEEQADPKPGDDDDEEAVIRAEASRKAREEMARLTSSLAELQRANDEMKSKMLRIMEERSKREDEQKMKIDTENPGLGMGP